MSEKEEVKKGLLDQLIKGGLVSLKHSVDSLGTPRKKFRTVVTQDNEVIREVLEKNEFRMFKYENSNPSQSKDLYQIVPNDSSIVPASGVPPSSPQPTYPCNSWVAVSGMSQPWHVYGDTESNLKSKKNLKFVGEI